MTNAPDARDVPVGQHGVKREIGGPETGNPFTRRIDCTDDAPRTPSQGRAGRRIGARAPTRPDQAEERREPRR